MTAWILQTLGLGDEIVSNLERATLRFEQPAWLWVGALAVIPVSTWLYRRQQRNLGSISPALSRGLTVLRGLVLALLFAALAGPYLEVDFQRDIRPLVALLFDHSESMQMPAGPFDDEARLTALAEAAGYALTDGALQPETRQALNRIGRIQLARSVVEAQAEHLLHPLGERFDLAYYTFADRLAASPTPSGAEALPAPPPHAGPATHIGDSLSGLLDDLGSRHLAGVLLFTDGRNTGGLSPSEAARRAAALSTPVYPVTLGAPAAFQDVSVVDIGTSGQVALGDTATVSVSIESGGLDGQRVKVMLLDGEDSLDERELALNGAERQHVDLSFETKEAGTRILTVRIPPPAEEPEAFHANNEDHALLDVSRDTYRVLYLEGLPRWDFRYLKNAMRRDRGLAGRTGKNPDIVLEAEHRRQMMGGAASAIPATVDEWADYHTVVLGDFSPHLPGPAFEAALAEAVEERGVGLVVMGGPLFMPHAFGDRLQELLPVRLHPGAAGLEAPVYRPFRIELAPEGAIHEVTRLYDEAIRNRTVWSGFPDFYWCAAVERPAPGATVLAWNSSVGGKQGSLPLIAYHHAGKGRVLFVGTDATWLWRQHAAERYFQRFWGQALRFVARKDRSARTTALRVAPQRLAPGQPTTVELHAFTPDGKPVLEKKLEVLVGSGAAAEAIEVIADRDREGRYTGTFTPEAKGIYRATWRQGEEGEAVHTEFLVTPSSLEQRNLREDPALLHAVAGASGGRVVPLTDLPGVVDELQGESTQAAVHHEASVWDNWLTVMLVVAFYALDVGLRRLTGLP